MEKIKLMASALADSRLRRDIKAFKIGETMYPHFAWKTLKELNIDSILENPLTLNEICSQSGIKNIKMLEYMLDLLVGQGAISYKGRKYKFIKEPKKLSDKEADYLKKNYPYSWKWSMGLIDKAKEALIKGKKFEETGFDDEEWLILWEGIMDEAPYSFRNMAIKESLKNIKEGSKILDLGCGGGVGLEGFLIYSKKKIFLVGIDGSKKYLNRAKKRLENLHSASNDTTLKNNLENLTLVHRDLRKQGIPKESKYNVVFLSIILNHIPEREREGFFREINDILTDDGFVVIYQIIHKGKFKRASMWPMEIIPSHHGYPYRKEYLDKISKVFKEVQIKLDGAIVVGKKKLC